MSGDTPYNPLERRNLGASVAEALLERQAVPLGELPKITGAGIYAIYYTGDFPCYQLIAEANRHGACGIPIYVGRAAPKGARKGIVDAEGVLGFALYERLVGDHAKSIGQVENLNLSDFHCRYLVVEDIWIPLGESLLISKFAPLWNTFIDGFGNHDPGKGRYKQLRSRWDALHPGRSWAWKCPERPETADQIASEIENHLKTQPSTQKIAAEGLRLFGEDE